MSFPETVPMRRRTLDYFEQITVVVLFGWLTVRLWPGELTASNWYPLLLLASEGIVVFLLIVRKPTDRISTSALDWALAGGGTFLPLLVGKGGPSLFGPAGAFLILFGMVVHLGAKLSLRRSFGLVAANRGIKSNGLYSIVRHPMYAGYILTHVGYLLLAPSLANLCVYLCAWALLIARIFVEERILGEDPGYLAFKDRVRFRLVPGVF